MSYFFQSLFRGSCVVMLLFVLVLSEGSRKFEEVGEGSRRFEELGEGSRRFEKVKTTSMENMKKYEKRDTT